MENLDEDALILRIDAYIKGRLPETEMADFTKKIAEKPVLAQQVAKQRVHLEAIEILLADDLRAKMNKWELEEKPNNFDWTKWILGVLALGILGGIYFFFKPKNNANIPIHSTINQLDTASNKLRELPVIKENKPVIAPQLQPNKNPVQFDKQKPKFNINVPIVNTKTFEIDTQNSVDDSLTPNILTEANTDLLGVINDFEKNSTRKGDNDVESDSIAKSYRFMQQKDYKSAINTLEKDQNTEGVFAKAMAYFLDGQYAEALPLFDKLTTNGFVQSEMAEYYAALCVYNESIQVEAIKRFAKIAVDKEHAYGDKAVKALKLIKNRNIGN